LPEEFGRVAEKVRHVPEERGGVPEEFRQWDLIVRFAFMGMGGTL